MGPLLGPLLGPLHTPGLAGVGAEAMLATSTRLLAALLNHRTSAEWFRAFGDEPTAAPQQLKVVKEETLGAGWSWEKRPGVEN